MMWFIVLCRSGMVVARIGGPFATRADAALAVPAAAYELYRTRCTPGPEELLTVALLTV